MWLTINEYCEKENITRPTYYYRVKKGYISKDRLKKTDGNTTLVFRKVEEVEVVE
jgi:hypothetical protein